MAARLNLRQQEQSRAAIQTTQLVKRLQHFALAEKDEQGAEVDIDGNRLRAIEVLLRKSLPDLSAVTVQGDEDNPLNIVATIKRVIVDANTTNRDSQGV